MRQKAYARAGVDIDLGNRMKAELPGLLASTRRREVLGKVGGFGGLFALDIRKFQEPVLVSSVDGVGTKLKVAFALDRHNTIGQDLVNHCVNDIAVVGAEPLFFLDYVGAGKLEPRVFTEIIRGFAQACAWNGCALIGGETAQMPGFYQPGEYDLSGTIVGVVERSAILDGKAIRPGDAVIGLASSGLHTNGYSLARRILFEEMKLKISSRVPELGRTVGEELLEVHRSYGPLTRLLLKKFNRRAPIIKAMAHITGGGVLDNIPRTLPKRCGVVLERGSWEVPPIFQLLRENSDMPEEELHQVFNMGIGMTLVAESERAGEVLQWVEQQQYQGWIIGEVIKGSPSVRLE